MMGLVLAFPARENGNTVYLVGTPLDQEIIDTASRTGQHPKFDRPFPTAWNTFNSLKYQRFCRRAI